MTRPGRRHPSWLSIARALAVDGKRPSCWKCGAGTPAALWTDKPLGLVKAHIIDRWAGGLDLPCNFRPLCELCHRLQPIFENGDEAAALEWFDKRCDPLEEFVRQRDLVDADGTVDVRWRAV